jgi:ribulose-phosphate 3-epimerase
VTGPSLLVAPSLLAADFSVDAARTVQQASDWLHLDIMDSRFVPNRTIGLEQTRTLIEAVVVPVDCHLMIVEPELSALGYAEAGAFNVTFHVEAARDPARLARDLRAAGARAGLAIDRYTPVEPYLSLLPAFDLLLIMTVKAGEGGQDFRPELLAKVRAARRHRDAGHLELRLEVDGGITEETIGDAAQAGADTFVAGTSVFDAADGAEAVRRLRARATAADRTRPSADDAAGRP